MPYYLILFHQCYKKVHFREILRRRIIICSCWVLLDAAPFCKQTARHLLRASLFKQYLMMFMRASHTPVLNIRHISITNGSNRQKAHTGNKKHYTNTYGNNKSLSWYRFISGFVWKKSRVDIPKGLAWLYYDNWVQWLYLRTNRNILWQKQEDKCRTNVMNY